MKTLRELLESDEIIEVSGSLDIAVEGIACDSRKVQSNGCYVAIQGFRRDGIEFLPQAMAAGIRAVVTMCAPSTAQPGLTWVQVKNDRRALSRMASRFFNNPSQRLKVVGVTGTNGKTTTAMLVDAVFNQVSRSAWIGTLGMEYRGERHHTSLTTPEAPDIFAFMGEAETRGCLFLAMEVSSASLTLFRVEDIRFRQAVFTSFSGEHLDFHGSMENYFAAKLSLFQRLPAESWAVINRDDPMADRICRELAGRYLTYGFGPLADVHPESFRFSLKGIEARLATPRGHLEIESQLVGRFNLYNIMAAACSALIEGIGDEEIFKGIAACKSVPGRAEMVHNGDFHVFVDFGHTDDALRHLLESLRELAGGGRLIIVFGAGGNKDKTKRPRMGAVAAALADIIVLTSDNPRDEDPEKIIDEIAAGIPSGKKEVHREADRRHAIALALSLARKGDIVAIAGKGHEENQVIRGQSFPFRDDAVAKELLEARDA